MLRPALKKFICIVQKEKQEDTSNRLERVPKENHQFSKLFQGRLDTVLPEHSKWDHEIPLKEEPHPSSIKSMD